MAVSASDCPLCDWAGGGQPNEANVAATRVWDNVLCGGAVYVMENDGGRCRGGMRL